MEGHPDSRPGLKMGDFVLRRFPGHDGCSAGKKTTEGGRILASEKKKSHAKRKVTNCVWGWSTEGSWSDLHAGSGTLTSLSSTDNPGLSSYSPEVAFGLVENNSPYKPVTPITW